MSIFSIVHFQKSGRLGRGWARIQLWDHLGVQSARAKIFLVYTSFSLLLLREQNWILVYATVTPNNPITEGAPILTPVCHSFWKWAIVIMSIIFIYLFFFFWTS